MTAQSPVSNRYSGPFPSEASPPAQSGSECQMQGKSGHVLNCRSPVIPRYSKSAASPKLLSQPREGAAVLKIPLALFSKDFQVSGSVVTDYHFWRLGVLRESVQEGERGRRTGMLLFNPQGT